MRRFCAPSGRGGGQPPYDAVLMFKVLVLPVLYGLSDDQTEFQRLDRRSFGRFLGLDDGDKVPDAKTIWLFRETLSRAGAMQRLSWLLSPGVCSNKFGEAIQY